MMRRVILVLFLFLIASQPSQASQGQDSEESLTLPAVQWNASADIGFISTAPLVTEGLVVVKGGGHSSLNIDPTLIAFRADTGVEVWRTTHIGSDYNFEISPLMYVGPEAGSGCVSNHHMVVTGWTSGVLTANDLVTGDKLWNITTTAPLWGITGEGIYLGSGQIIWPTETGVIQVCAVNGTILNQHDDNNLRTYRANLGMWWEGSSSLPSNLGWLQGTEDGHIIRYDVNTTLVEDIDVAELANLSESWKIRSTPWYHPSLGIITHILGEGETRILRIDWNETGAPFLVESIPHSSGTATLPAGNYGMDEYVFAGTEKAIFFEEMNGSMIESIQLNVTGVTGEIRVIKLGHLTDTRSVTCFPQNTASGSWLITTDTTRTTWFPDQPGWVTAGCGSDGTVHAVANDASWLEVRFDPYDFNSIEARADSTLGTIEDDDVVQKSSQSSDSLTLILLPFFGAALLGMIAQSSSRSDTRRQMMIGAVLMIILGLGMATTLYNSQVVDDPIEDSSGRMRISEIVPQLEEQIDDNEVLVAFHFPEEFAPTNCEAGEVRWNSTGAVWYISPVPDESYCVMVSIIETQAGFTVEDATVQALDEMHFQYEIEHMILGSFLNDIEAAVGGSSEYWWTYDLNGGYGTIGIAEQVIQPGDEIGWHFDKGEY